MNLAYGQGGLKLEINIPPQHISAKSKGGLIIEGGVSSSEYGSCIFSMHSDLSAFSVTCLKMSDDQIIIVNRGKQRLLIHGFGSLTLPCMVTYF